MIAFEGAQRACEQIGKLPKGMTAVGREDWEWAVEIEIGDFCGDACCLLSVAYAWLWKVISAMLGGDGSDGFRAGSIKYNRRQTKLSCSEVAENSPNCVHHR